jgi:hypothetical protein
MKQETKERTTTRLNINSKKKSSGLKSNFKLTAVFTKNSALNENGKKDSPMDVSNDVVNSIIDFFNKQALITVDLEINSQKAIKGIGFAYPTDNAELQSLIDNHIAHSKKLSADGIKNILKTFSKHNLHNGFEQNYYEEVDFVIESSAENNHLCAGWLEQTIEEPWFKN